MNEAIPTTLATLGMHLFAVDHPDLPECIGRHAPDRPCNGERGKHPVPLSWAKESTTCRVALHRAFGHGLRNIGIDCGPSRLVVLDEDSPSEMDQLCCDHRQPVPETLTVATGKGRHFYFRQPPELPFTNAEGALRGYQMNVRGRGGYVVAPGSKHASGCTYDLLVAAPVALVPEWIAVLLRPQAPAPRLAPAPAIAGSRQALAGLLRVVLEAPAGRRNITLNWAAYRMFEKARAGQVIGAEADEMLLLAATAVGLPEGEARGTIGSARRAVLG
jgi:hypothetical protein